MIITISIQADAPDEDTTKVAIENACTFLTDLVGSDKFRKGSYFTAPIYSGGKMVGNVQASVTRVRIPCRECGGHGYKVLCKDQHLSFGPTGMRCADCDGSGDQADADRRRPMLEEERRG